MVVTVTPLVPIMKDKVEELCNLGLIVFSSGTGDKEGFAKGSTSVSNRTAWTFCCPGVTSNTLFLKGLKTKTTSAVLHLGKFKNFSKDQQTNALSFSLHFPIE